MEYGWPLTEDPTVSVDGDITTDRCGRIHGGRSDFDGIDNEAIDFSQLENFINDDSDATNQYFADTLAHNEVSRAHAAAAAALVAAAAASSQDVLVQQQQHHQPQPQDPTKHPPQPQQQPPPAFSMLGTTENGTVYVLPHSLPESPPDSGSEPPYSPQDHGGGGQSPHERLGPAHSRGHTLQLQDMLMQPMFATHQAQGPGPGQPQSLHLSVQTVPVPADITVAAVAGLPAGLPPGPTHTLHLQGAGGETILVQHPVVLAMGPSPSTSTGLPPPTPSPAPHQLPPGPPLTPQLQTSPVGLVSEGQIQDQGVFSGLSDLNANSGLSDLNATAKKRKLSQDGRIHVKTEPGMTELSQDSNSSDLDASALDDDFGMDVASDVYLDSTFQCIRFSPFQPTDWHILCDQKFQDLPPPKYQVVADKGFNFSNADDAFVCQKKNHFQVTCHVKILGDAQFVKTAEGFKKILAWQLHFYGVKTEAPAQMIKVEQSQSDRSKKAFHPVSVELRGDERIKKTVGRLHFSETTANNMRKKGKPNPDQRYFYLVVGLHAHCSDDLDYPIISHNSERIIVRASNPGQFESDGELCWQKGSVSDSIYHTGRCGINTDRPEEALTVHGNLRITGHVIQPSDQRAKEAIKECDTREQLRNVQQIRVVQYRYTEDFAEHAGLANTVDTGVIAQEVQNILPEAVRTAGDVVLPNGTKLDNFLVVNRDRLFMENVGAVKELCKVTDNLENRIDELERMNRRLTNIKRLDSFKSISSSYSGGSSIGAGTAGLKKHRRQKSDSFTASSMCSNKFIQITIVILVLIMAFCLVAMVTLYFLEFQRRNQYDPDFPYKPTATQRQSQLSIATTSRPVKHPNKSGPPVHNKKTTTVSPHRKHKGDRERGEAEGEEEPVEHPAVAPERPRQPPILGGPPQCLLTAVQAPPYHQQQAQQTQQGEEGVECQTFCCRPESVLSVNGRNAAISATVEPPAAAADPLTKTPPVVLNSNSLSTRLQRAASEEGSDRDNYRENYFLDYSASELGVGGPSAAWASALPPRVSIHGTHLNHTVDTDFCDPSSAELSRCVEHAASNYSYLIPLSRFLGDHTLEFRFNFRHKWQWAEACTPYVAPTKCSWSWSKESREVKEPPGQVVDAVVDSAHPAHPDSGQTDAAAKQHLFAGSSGSGSSGDRHFVEIGPYLTASAVFRVPRSVEHKNLCHRSRDRLGHDFWEYNFSLKRVCQE